MHCRGEGVRRQSRRVSPSWGGGHRRIDPAAVSHTKFCARRYLKFTLLSDKDRQLTKELGILRRLIGAAKRTIYLIKPDGEMIKEWLDVKPAFHAKEVLNYMQSLA